MYIGKKNSYDSIVTDNEALEKLSEDVFLQLTHPLNFVGKAVQVQKLLEKDRLGRREISDAIQCCYTNINLEIQKLQLKVSSLEERPEISDRYCAYFAGFDA